MTVLLSNRVRGERAKEHIDSLLTMVMETTQHDRSLMSDEQAEAAGEEIRSKFRAYCEKLTCGQMTDLYSYAQWLEEGLTMVLMARAEAYEALECSENGPAKLVEAHRMCDAERQMYDMMDELDRSL